MDQIEAQCSFFYEAEVGSDQNTPEPTLDDAVSGYKRDARKPKTVREEILKNLPVVEIECDLTDKDKKRPYCNADMIVLGKGTVREELRIIPAKIERIRYIRVNYICPTCKAND